MTMTTETGSETAIQGKAIQDKATQGKATQGKIDEIVARARSLYSLPAVAAEVIQLTSNPKVDAQALKECIQTDPALTAKILRVVNSSLFGLSREVTDLNQAIALLGTKPLKLLVLGFSLPENMFSEMAREQLDWYWSTTLARAVAAREISEEIYNRPGDDAFLAGLLQDLGVLVLLGQFKESYAKFLAMAIEQQLDLRHVEIDSLGFDHLSLTSALLEHWNMPKVLVNSISAPRDCAQLMKDDSPEGELARILHMAGLLAELVGQKRLAVLPDLLEVGNLYCGIDKARWTELIISLQPKTEQLAEVLSLDFAKSLNYSEIIAQAHAQMSELAEAVVKSSGQAPRANDEPSYGSVASDTVDLRRAVDDFLQRPMLLDPRTDHPVEPAAEELEESPNRSTATSGSTSTAPAQWSQNFLATLTFVVGQSRSRRQPVSVVLMGIRGSDDNDARQQQMFAQTLDAACRRVDVKEALVEPFSGGGRALVLPGCDRQQAVRHADETISWIDQTLKRLAPEGSLSEYCVSVGVAAVTLPPKNFPPADLLETAERCLTAARSGGTSIVKSLEIY